MVTDSPGDAEAFEPLLKQPITVAHGLLLHPLNGELQSPHLLPVERDLGSEVTEQPVSPHLVSPGSCKVLVLVKSWFLYPLLQPVVVSVGRAVRLLHVDFFSFHLKNKMGRQKKHVKGGNDLRNITGHTGSQQVGSAARPLRQSDSRY